MIEFLKRHRFASLDGRRWSNQALAENTDADAQKERRRKNVFEASGSSPTGEAAA